MTKKQMFVHNLKARLYNAGQLVIEKVMGRKVRRRMFKISIFCPSKVRLAK